MADIVIRNATVEDSGPIAGLTTELGYPTSTSQMQQRLEAIVGDDDYATFVACDDAEIVGVIGTRTGRLYEVDESYGQIMVLSVAGGHQRRGIGWMLLRAAEESLVERGAGILIVTTANHRADAHAFYEQCGYTFTGRRYRKSASVSG